MHLQSTDFHTFSSTATTDIFDQFDQFLWLSYIQSFRPFSTKLQQIRPHAFPLDKKLSFFPRA